MESPDYILPDNMQLNINLDNWDLFVIKMAQRQPVQMTVNSTVDSNQMTQAL